MMHDVILESILTAVLLYILIFLIRVGKTRAKLCHGDWCFIVAGFGLLLFASIIDITDNFESLNRFVVIGDTKVQAFLEKTVGLLCGFILLAIGLAKWIPTTTSIRHIEKLNKDMIEKNAKTRKAESKYYSLYNSMNEGVCLHSLVYSENGNASDYRILDTNKAYEKILGIKKETITGKLASEAYKTNPPPFLEIYSRVAETGEPEAFDTYFEPMAKHFNISVFSPEKGKFATIFTDITKQKQLDNAIQASEERYRTLFQSSHDAIMTLSPPSWIFTSGNPAAIKMFGLKDEQEFTSKGPWDISPKHQPDGQLSSDKAKAMVGKAVKNGSNFFEWTHKKLNGNDFPTTVLLTRMKEDGNIFIEATVRDISEQKKAESALKDEKEMLKKVFEAAPVGMLLLDENTNVKEANSTVGSMILRDPGEIIGQRGGGSLGCIHSTEDIRGCGFSDSCPNCALRNGIESVLASGESIHNTEIQPTLLVDGKEISPWLIVNAELVILNGKKHVIVAIIDISEQKKAESALKDEKEMLKKVFEAAPVGMLLLDENTNVKEANSTVGSMVLRDPGEIIGQRVGGSLGCIHSTEDIKGCGFSNSCPNCVLRNGVESVLASGESIHNAEVQLTLLVDGKEISPWLNVNAEPVILGGKQHIIVAITDISEQKQIAEQLQETNDQLEEAIGTANEMAIRAESANIAKSLFLANMSHEIRTPMNGVLGMTQLLAETSLSDQQDEYVNMVKNSAESLLEVINDILNYSKIEAGKVKLESIDFSLPEMMNTLIAIRAVTAEQKGLDLTCNIAPDIPNNINGDPTRLRQILTNLIGNAIKFTKQGCIAISVNLSPVINNYQSLSGDKIDNHEVATTNDVTLRFSVRDTGIGISAEQQELLFQSFSQVDDSITRKYGGSGLGLAISKQLVEMMDGEIGIISPVEKRGTLSQASTHAGGLAGNPLASEYARRRTGGEPSGSEFWFTVKFQKAETVIKTGELTPHSDLPLPRSSPVLLRAYSLARGFSAPRSLHILVAEDNHINQIVAKEILEKLGATVDVVSDGKEAIKQLELGTGNMEHGEKNNQKESTTPCSTRRLPYSYDLVFMDVQMPIMGGYEATRRIRAIEEIEDKKRIPIIAMTAHAMPEDREKCIKVGMDDYTSKPITKEELERVIAKWTEGENPLASEYARRRTGGEPSRKRVRTQEDRRGTLSQVSSFKSQVSAPIFSPTPRIKALGCDTEMFCEILDVFLEDMPIQIEKLKEALETSNNEASERHAHSIKGASKTVGAESFAALAYKMEKAGHAGDLQEEANMLNDLTQEFEKLKKEIESWQNELA